MRAAVVLTTKDASSNIQVELLGQVYVCRCSRALTPAVGDIVVLDRTRSGMWAATGLLFPSVPAAPAAIPPGERPPAPPPPKKTTVTKTTAYSATYSGTYRPQGGWRTDNDEVRQGSYAGDGPNQGLWTYGSAVTKALLGSTAVSGTLTVKRISGGVYAAQPISFYETAAGSKPGGAPSWVGGAFTTVNLKVGQQANITLPTAVIGRLISGATKGIGISTGSSPYAVLAGRKTLSVSGRLIITSTRTA